MHIFYGLFPTSTYHVNHYQSLCHWTGLKMSMLLLWLNFVHSSHSILCPWKKWHLFFKSCIIWSNFYQILKERTVWKSDYSHFQSQKWLYIHKCPFVRLSISHKTKSPNSLKSSSFILHPLDLDLDFWLDNWRTWDFGFGHQLNIWNTLR